MAPTTQEHGCVGGGLSKETDQKVYKRKPTKWTPEVMKGAQQQNLDIGLVNIATNESNKNTIPIWEIVDVISALILILLVIRWIKK